MFPIHRGAVKKAMLIIGIAFVVFGIFIPVTVTLVTFVLPETFASSAKIAYTVTTTSPLEAAVGKIMARSSLEQVANNLDLPTEWAKKYKQRGQLSLAQCYTILSKMIQISVPRGSPLIEIRIYSDNRDEAASIANELAAVYLRTAPGSVIIERAEPAFKPVRPNKRLNIALGIAAGATIFIIGLAALIAARILGGNRNGRLRQHRAAH